MAVTGDRRRRTLFDVDQGCYRTSSGNRESRFGRGCVQTSAAVDGGRSFPPTPLFSGPSDGERGSRRWSARQRSRSPPSRHRYHRHLEPPSSFSSQHPIHLHHYQPSSPSTNSHTLSHRASQFHNNHYTQSRFAMTHENQTEITNTHTHFNLETHHPSQFCDHQNAINSTRETQFTKTKTQSTKTHLHPRKLSSTHETYKKIEGSHRGDLLDFDSKDCITINDQQKGIEHLKDFVGASCSVIQPESDVLKSNSPHKANCILFPQMSQTRPNSNSKPKPTLPKGRPTTLIDMMHFVSNWFDCDEILVDEITESENIAKNEEDGRLLCDCEEIWVDESTESERINRIEGELSKNETGDDAFCDALGDRVVGFGNSIQEKLVDCFDVVKNEEGNDKMEFSGDIIVNCDNSVQEKGNHEQSGSQLGGNSKSPTRELTDSEPGFMISENNVKNVSNIRKGSNSDGVQNGSQLVGELRSLDKQVIQGESDMLRSGKNSGKVVDCYDVVEQELSNFGNFIYLEAVAFELASELKLDLVEVQRNAIVESGPHVDKRQTYAITRQYEKLGGAKRLKALRDASSVDRTIVSTLSVGFENFKTKGVKRRQWQIAWSFPTFRWTIVLVPLWISDELRRDFSVGVYHSHKTNRFPLVVLLATKCSVSACFNRIRGRILFKERVTDVGDKYC